MGLHFQKRGGLIKKYQLLIAMGTQQNFILKISLQYFFFLLKTSTCSDSHSRAPGCILELQGETLALMQLNQNHLTGAMTLILNLKCFLSGFSVQPGLRTLRSKASSAFCMNSYHTVRISLGLGDVHPVTSVSCEAFKHAFSSSVME